MSGTGHDSSRPQRSRREPMRFLVFELIVEFLGSLAVNFAANLLASDLGPRGQLVVILVLLPVGGAAYLFYRRRHASRQPPPRDERGGEGVRAPHERLPPREELLGTEQLVEQTVEHARAHRLVLVHGPGGSGVSAIAVAAARILAPDAQHQQYVDLRGQNPRQPDSARRVAERVLSVLGHRLGRTQPESAAEKVRQSLADTGRVLVLDNVTQAEQVSWILGPVPGAYLILAGDFPAHRFPKLAEVAVGRLDADAALHLMLRQDTHESPGRRLADRVSADPEVTRVLVERYLTRPRLAIEVGKWLSTNQSITLAQLLENLERGDSEPTAVSSYILGQLLEGASRDAKRLRANLAQLPIATLAEPAVAALLGVTPARAVSLLNELIDRGLVEQSAVGRYRLQDPARSLDAAPSSLAEGDLLRLLDHYATLATRHRRALSGRDNAAEAQRWFRLEDTALLELLGLPAPPGAAAGPLRRIADALDRWFGSEGRIDDRAAAAEAMLRAAEHLGDTGMRTTALRRLMVTSAAGGDLDGAVGFYAAADELAESTALSGDGNASLHACRGLWHLIDGQVDPALREFKESYDTRPRGDSVGRVVDLTNLAAALLHLGRPAEAERRLRDARGRARDTDDRGGEAHALELLGVAAYRQHQPLQARARWDEAERLYEQVGDDAGQARCLLHTSIARLHQGPDGDDTEAVTALRRSLELRGDGRTGVGVALCNLHLGRCALSRKDTDQAREHQRAGLAALRPWDNRAVQPHDVRAARDYLTALTSSPT